MDFVENGLARSRKFLVMIEDHDGRAHRLAGCENQPRGSIGHVGKAHAEDTRLGRRGWDLRRKTVGSGVNRAPGEESVNEEGAFLVHIDWLGEAGDQGDWIPKKVWQGSVSVQLGGNDP